MTGGEERGRNMVQSMGDLILGDLSWVEKVLAF